MARIATYQHQVPLRDAPNVKQDFDTDIDMSGGNQAVPLDAWGNAFDKMGGAIDTFANADSPAKQPSAAQVLYGGSDKDKSTPEASQSVDTYVSAYDRNHLGTLTDGYKKAKRSNDPDQFRTAMSDIGASLRSYPHLERHWPPEAVQAYRDFSKVYDENEQQNFTAKGLKTTFDDRARMAQAAAAKVLNALAQAAMPVRPTPADGPKTPEHTRKNWQFRNAATDMNARGSGDSTLAGGSGSDKLKAPAPEYPTTPVPRGTDLPEWAAQAGVEGDWPWEAVPPYRKEAFKAIPGAWTNYNIVLREHKDLSDTGRFVLGQIFAAEGGTAIDRSDPNHPRTSSGIIRDTLQWAKGEGKYKIKDPVPGIADIDRPEDLDLAQRAAITKRYLDETFRHIGGLRGLDAIGDAKAAATLADVFFRSKGGAATKLVQDAIRKLLPGRLPAEPVQAPGSDKKPEPLVFGRQSLEAYAELMKDPRTRRALLDDIANKRLEKARDRETGKQREQDRIEHYRWPAD